MGCYCFASSRREVRGLFSLAAALVLFVCLFAESRTILGIREGKQERRKMIERLEVVPAAEAGELQRKSLLAPCFLVL